VRPRAQQRREYLHRELRVVWREPLRLLPEYAELELAALFERTEIQLAIVLALGSEPLVVAAKPGDLFDRRQRRGHAAHDNQRRSSVKSRAALFDTLPGCRATGSSQK
jgi:hypothetical protein